MLTMRGKNGVRKTRAVYLDDVQIGQAVPFGDYWEALDTAGRCWGRWWQTDWYAAEALKRSARAGAIQNGGGTNMKTAQAQALCDEALDLARTERLMAVATARGLDQLGPNARRDCESLRRWLARGGRGRFPRQSYRRMIRLVGLGGDPLAWPLAWLASCR